MTSAYITIYNFFFTGVMVTKKIISHITNKTIEITGSVVKKAFQRCNRHRIIKDKDTDEAYLERYYLCLKDRTDFPFNIFIHKFLKSDPDDLHDHPWSYFTCILRGGYLEHTPSGKFWRGPFTCKCGAPNDLHRIELNPQAGECWTLFIPGKKIRKWGFMTDDGWIQHENYNKTN